MGFRTIEDQQRAVEAAQWENAKEALLAYVYQKFPTLVICDANNRMIVEQIEWWGGPQMMPTVEAFTAMLEENGEEALSCLVRQPMEKTRQQLIEDILSLLASKDGGRDGKYDQFNLRSEGKRMASWSLDALRARLHEIRVKQKMVTFPVSDLKTYVADAHRVERPYPDFPTLPPTMWNGNSHVKVDAEYLNGLARTDIWSFKRLVKLYGSTQIDDRRGVTR